MVFQPSSRELGDVVGYLHKLISKALSAKSQQLKDRPQRQKAAAPYARLSVS